MGVRATVVFTDLHGSTAVFESAGNARATEVVTEITAWIAKRCRASGGRVVKTLGDGVLAIFSTEQSAVSLVVDLQRAHYKRLLSASLELRLPMRIGVATGDVEMVAND